MKKKYILSIIILLQVFMILIVVSYAWFHPDSFNKTIQGNELSITASEDLILKHKGVTYSSLRLNDIFPSGFIFEQVSSTGLNDDGFYKIDYSPRLNGLPAQYVEATANADYIDFTVTLQTSSRGKRIYLDGPNSGFSFAEKEGDALYNNYEAANCMRMSLTFYDDNANLRSVVFSNNRVKSYVVKENDFYVLNSSTHTKQYYNGELYLADYAETVHPYEEITISGKENTYAFEEYDLNYDKEGLILFDLNPRQSKDITVRIWLDGTAVNQTIIGDKIIDNITGRPVSISLRFTSSLNQAAIYKSTIVDEGDRIVSIKDYLAKNEQFVNGYYVEQTQNIYYLSPTNYELDESGNAILTLEDGTTRTYHPEIINYKTYYKAAGDPIYYDLENSKGYIKYGDLTWTLHNNVSNIKFSGVTTYHPYPEDSSKYLLGEIDSDNEIEVYYGDIGDMFNLVGYFVSDSIKTTVINESYVFGKTIEFVEMADKRIANLTENYTDNLVSTYNNVTDTYYVIEDGEYKVYSYDNTTNFVWVVKDYSGGTANIPYIINNCVLQLNGYYYLSKNGEGKFNNIVVNAATLSNNATFILAGCHIDENGVLHEVVRQLYYVYSN